MACPLKNVVTSIPYRNPDVLPVDDERNDGFAFIGISSAISLWTKASVN